GGLRIVEQRFDIRRDWGAYPNRAGSKLAVVLEAAGNEAAANCVERAGKRLNAAVIYLQRHAAAERHLPRVAQQAEAGDIGNRVNPSCLAHRMLRRERYLIDQL